MQSLKQLCYCSFVFVSFVRFAVAWTTSGLAVDLTWPPPGNEGYFTQNGQLVAPNIDPAPFPCASISPPISTTLQTKFPLTGAHIQFDLLNKSAQAANYRFTIDTYLGQFSNDVSPDKKGWTYVSTLEYRDFTSGSQCTDPINITNEVATAPSSNLDLDDTSAPNLVGVSLTLGLRIVLFDGDYNYEEMYQCSYLNLIADDASVTQDRGVCNPSSKGTASASSSSTTATASPSVFTITGTAVPSSTSTSTPTVIMGAGNASANNSVGHNSRTIGIAIGVSVGATALFLLLGLFLIRRRRSAKSKGALAFNHAEGNKNGTPDKGEKRKGEVVTTAKACEDGNDNISIGGSDHSEPLPPYHRGNEDSMATMNRE